MLSTILFPDLKPRRARIIGIIAGRSRRSMMCDTPPHTDTHRHTPPHTVTCRRIPSLVVSLSQEPLNDILHTIVEKCSDDDDGARTLPVLEYLVRHGCDISRQVTDRSPNPDCVAYRPEAERTPPR